MKAGIAVGLVLIATGCATSERTAGPEGRAEYRISCGYFGWYICYEKAKEVCPGEYKVISEREALNGRELRIACIQR